MESLNKIHFYFLEKALQPISLQLTAHGQVFGLRKALNSNGEIWTYLESLKHYGLSDFLILAEVEVKRHEWNL